MRTAIYIALLLSLIEVNSFAQEQKKGLAQQLKSKELKFLPVPSFSATTENGLMLGAALDYYYTIGGRQDNPNTRPSVTWVQVLYSTKNQLIAELFTSTFTKNEKFFITGRGGYLRTYENFWAYEEPLLSNRNYVSADLDRLYINAKAFYQARKSLFIGLQLNASSYNNTQWRSSIASAYVPAYVNSSVIGAGPAILYDKRDNQFSPNKGPYYELGLATNRDLRNQMYTYNNWYLDIRNYRLIKKHHVSYQFYTVNNYGTVPFFEKNRLGGNMQMRGMFQGRFRSDKIALVQGEYRYQIKPRFKLAGFAAIAATQDKWNQLNEKNFNGTAGAGLRYLLDKKKTIYIRLDLGTSTQGEFGYYLKVGDAF